MKKLKTISYEHLTLVNGINKNNSMNIEEKDSITAEKEKVNFYDKMILMLLQKVTKTIDLKKIMLIVNMHLLGNKLKIIYLSTM